MITTIFEIVASPTCPPPPHLLLLVLLLRYHLRYQLLHLFYDILFRHLLLLLHLHVHLFRGVHPMGE